MPFETLVEEIYGYWRAERRDFGRLVREALPPGSCTACRQGQFARACTLCRRQVCTHRAGLWLTDPARQLCWSCVGQTFYYDNDPISSMNAQVTCTAASPWTPLRSGPLPESRHPEARRLAEWESPGETRFRLYHCPHCDMLLWTGVSK